MELPTTEIQYNHNNEGQEAQHHGDCYGDDNADAECTNVTSM